MKKTKKQSKPSFIEQIKSWDIEDKDLLADLRSSNEGNERMLGRRRDGVWEPKPIKKLESFELASFKKVYPVLAVVLCIVLISVLMLTVADMPVFGSPDTPGSNEVSQRYIESGLDETGAVNIVAGMILDYRAFDTLGESHVLFTAVCAVLILLLDDRHELGDPGQVLETDAILKLSVSMLFPIILLFGIYVILNGHLSPGGGFSGGAIIGADLILYAITFGYKKTSRFINLKVFRVISVCALCFYSLSKAYSFFMGANGLESGISNGVPGMIFSSGLILPLNIAVGLVVACTMYGFYSVFRRGRI